MTLDAEGFIPADAGRARQASLPAPRLAQSFMRIHHFGFLAYRAKKQTLAQCRKLLKLALALPESPILSAKDLLVKITGVDLSRCPCCHEGTMIVVGDLPPLSSLPRWDSS